MSDKPPQRICARILTATGLLFIGVLPACSPPNAREIPPPAATSETGCGESGMLEGDLFGSLETSVSWTGSDLLCENMLRPDNEGVRLRFAGGVGGERLAFIVSLPGLRRGGSDKELPTNVTLTIEGSGRFFSTPNFDTCWTDVKSHVPLDGESGSYRLDGTLYCVAALGEINGDAAVSIPELTFSTIVVWIK